MRICVLCMCMRVHHTCVIYTHRLRGIALTIAAAVFGHGHGDQQTNGHGPKQCHRSVFIRGHIHTRTHILIYMYTHTHTHTFILK